MSEPAWIDEARRLRAEGRTYRKIADRVEASVAQVHYWLKVGEERVCPTCSETYEARDPRQRFCSSRCALPTTRTPDAREKRVKSLSKRNVGAAHPRYKNGSSVGRPTRKSRARFQSGQRRCQHPGCDRTNGYVQQHHVTYAQHVQREGGDVDDPRNALALCARCHGLHHRATCPVPLYALRDENYEFALELLGPAAFDYLARRYSGGDVRHDALLADAA